MERCAACGANLALVGRVHNCVPRISRGGVEGHALAPATEFVGNRASDIQAGNRAANALAEQGKAGIKPGPRETKPKRGRPRIGEKHEPHRPWLAAGMSERTYYRRKAEERAKERT